MISDSPSGAPLRVPLLDDAAELCERLGTVVDLQAKDDVVVVSARLRARAGRERAKYQRAGQPSLQRHGISFEIHWMRVRSL